MINTPTGLKGAAALVDINTLEGAHTTRIEFELAHHVAGRLRLRSPALKGNPCGVEQRRQQLAAIAGVISAAANPTTGSFLLTYDAAAMPPDVVAEALASRGIKLRTAIANPAPHTRGGEELIAALRRLALEVLAGRLMLAVVGLAA